MKPDIEVKLSGVNKQTTRKENDSDKDESDEDSDSSSDAFDSADEEYQM